MLEATDFTRVDEALEEVAQTEHDNILSLHALQEKYTRLQETLKDLPARTSYSVTVPFGKRAFIPGRIVHSNEVMVLIGAGYFVLQSATQAAEIASRREKFFDDEIACLRKRLKSIKVKCEVSKTMAGAHEDGAVEIREHIGADGEQLEHAIQAINPRRAGVQMEAPVPAPDSTEALSSYRGLDMDDLVRRLEEEERASCKGDDAEGAAVDKGAGAGSGGGGTSGEGGPDSAGLPTKGPLGGGAFLSPKSPRDIYEMHSHSAPADDAGAVTAAVTKRTEQSKVGESAVSADTASAFNGVVAERTGPQRVQSVDAPDTAPPQRVSKFKQSRMQARGAP